MRTGPAFFEKLADTFNDLSEDASGQFSLIS